MSRWLVVGCYATLRQDLIAALGTAPGGQEVTGVDRDSVDTTDPGACLAATTSDSIVRPAPRPAHSVRGHDAWQRAGLAPIRDWRDALTLAAADVARVPV
jgi:dTDP-4-dehydrorhamnose reductase